MDRLKDLNWAELLDLRLFAIKGVDVTVASILTFLVILLVTLVISNGIRRAIRRGFRARHVTDEGTIAVTLRLTHYVVMIVGSGIALNTLGIDLTALFAAGAVFAVAIGFAMQNIVQNFVSGVILLIERSITPGDVIEVEGELVRVSRMSIRTTRARTLSDEEMIIPNSTLVQSIVTNYTLQDKLYRVTCDVGVAYESDMNVVLNTLDSAARTIEWRVADQEPAIRMTAFADSSVNFSVSVWIDDPWSSAARSSDLHTTIWWALKEANVTIAFPQIDVHLDKEVSAGLARAV